MNHLYIFTILLFNSFHSKAAEIGTIFYRDDFTLKLNNDFPYAGALHKFFEDKFEFVCTLVLIRPLWLLGSIIHCNLEFDRPNNSTELTDMDYMMIKLHKNNHKIKRIIFPDDITNDIAIFEILYNSSEDYQILPSLDLNVFNLKYSKCFSVDFKEDDTNILIFNDNQIINDVEKCTNYISYSQVMWEKFLCTEVLNKSNTKYNFNGPLFCINDVDTIDVFGLKVDEQNDMKIWVKLSYYRLYIHKIVDKILNDMFNFPNMAYLTNKNSIPPDEHLCTLFFIRENWLVGSIIECHLNDISTSIIKYINTDWNSWFVSVVSNKKNITTNVTKMKFHDDFNEITQVNDIALIQVNPFEYNDSFPFLLPKSIDIGECYTKYTSCNYIFWIHNQTQWGLCTAHASINYQNLCPTENLNLQLKDNAACTKNIIINGMSNTFVLLCDKVDGTYDLIGMKIFDFNINYHKILRKQKENWISFMKNKQMIQQKIDINENVVSKMESIAILLKENKDYCTIAFLTYNSDRKELWYAGTLIYCKLYKLRDDIMNEKPIDWNNFTVITPYDEKLNVTEIFFDNYMDTNDTIFILKCMVENGTKYDSKAYQIISDKQPENECIRLYGVYDSKTNNYVFKSEENEVIYDKNKCIIKQSEDSTDYNWYCSSARTVSDTITDGVLLCKLSSIYHLIGLRTDYQTSLDEKFRKWLILSTYKSWLGYVVNAEQEGRKKLKYKSKNQIHYENLESNAVFNNFDFGVDIDMPEYMVKIIDTSTPCIGYGYVLLRNLIITGSQCNLLVNKSSSNLFKPVDNVASILIETKSQEMSLVRYVIYPEYNSSVSLKEIALLLLEWPLMIGYDFTKIHMPGNNDFNISVNTVCNIISPVRSNVFKPLGYTGKSDLTKMEITIVDIEVCSKYYIEEWYVPWNYIVCTEINEGRKEIIFTDYSSGLFCNNQLVAIAAEVYNDPLSAIPVKQEGKHVPTGWIRLGLFQNLIKTFYDQDWSYLLNITYSNEADWTKWNFMCSIQYEKHHLTSCVLISDVYILTSSDVITPNQLSESKDLLTVVFNSYDLKKSDNEEIHKIYSIQTVSNKSSLLLIRLVTKVSDNITRVNIIEDFILLDNLKCEAAGWPRDSITKWYHYEKFNNTQTLRSKKYTIEFSLNDYIMTKIDDNKECIPDVGMPLICEDQLIGISISDEKCDNNNVRQRWINVGELKYTIESLIIETYQESVGEIDLRANFLAAIFINDEYRCIGTLINDQWVLTSAYCFQNATFSNMKVILGLNDIKDVVKARSFTVKKYSVPYVKCDDIALVELSQPANLSNRVSLIDIISGQSNRLCKMFNVYSNISVGWPDKLIKKRKIQMYVLHPHIDPFCSFPNRTIKNHHVCTYIHKKDASFLQYPGGPLMCVPYRRKHKIQFALNAWGTGSTINDKTTVVWTFIDKYSDWIFTKTHNFEEINEMDFERRKNDIETFHETKIFYYSNPAMIPYQLDDTIINFISMFVILYYFL